MTGGAAATLAARPDPTLAALLIAVDPVGLGGVALRARTGPPRDIWLARFRDLLPAETPWRRLPSGTEDSRLFGGLDLAASLAAGRPVAERGILAETDGGVLVLAMAERLSDATAARLGSILDSGTVLSSRAGPGERLDARLGMVALDEGIDDERLPAALLERMAFWVELGGIDPNPPLADGRRSVAEARSLYPKIVADDAILAMLSETAMALGIGSLRASIMALRAARALAALGGRSAVATEDAALAARLVLAPRATRLPVDKQEDKEADLSTEPRPERQTDAASSPTSDEATAEREGRADPAAADLVLAAAKAAIPPGLLRHLQAVAAMHSVRSAPGRAGAPRSAAKRGRPAGVRRGSPGGAARLNLIETLRAAAPWQRLRGRPDPAAATRNRLEIRRDDLRITRFKQRTETTTIFVVDASGSLALNRLAEAKGAVELLLAECYIRRDQVALLAFRGKGAELLLPPTRSLTRAKRCLGELPGGGPTPLAGAIDAAVLLADQLRRRGQAPIVVFLTDGRANVARDGAAGRGRAEEDAMMAAKVAGAAGIRMLVVDASPRPQAQARALADAMKAMYLPMPRADAASLSSALRAGPIRPL